MQCVIWPGSRSVNDILHTGERFVVVFNICTVRQLTEGYLDRP